MPESSHKPLTPAPVPTSTTARPGQPGQQAQQRADGRCHRPGSGVHGLLAGGGDDGVLGDRPSACLRIRSAGSAPLPSLVDMLCSVDHLRRCAGSRATAKPSCGPWVGDIPVSLSKEIAQK